MGRSWMIVLLLVVGLGAFLAGSAYTEDEAPMSEEELWAWVMKMGQPGEPHQKLATLCGNWTSDATFIMESGEIKSAGKSAHAMMLGGRFLKMEYSGDMMGSPFNGMGLLAYNNVTQQYQSLWIDSMSTGFSLQNGQASDGGATITLLGEWQGPEGMRMPQKSVWTLPVDGKARLQMYSRRGESSEWILEGDLHYTLAR